MIYRSCLRTLFLLLFVALLGRVHGQSQFIFVQTFSDNFTGWSIDNGSNDAHTWQIVPNGYFDGSMVQSINGTKFAFVNSDNAGVGTHLVETLYSPVYNTTNHSNLYLLFDEVFRAFPSGDKGEVQVFDGAMWHTVYSVNTNSGTWNDPNEVTLNLSQYSNAQFQVRFVYDDNNVYAWYWALDNVYLKATTRIDLSANAIVEPAFNGRELSSLSYSTQEPITIQIINYETSPSTNFEVYYSINGLEYGPEIVTDTIYGNDTLIYTFQTPADLSEVNTYDISARTSLSNDLNTANDVLSSTHVVKQLPNDIVQLPYLCTFESATSVETSQSGFVGVGGLPYLDYYNNSAFCRIRTASFLSIPFGDQSQTAITLDRSSNGNVDELNEAFITFNLSNKNAVNDILLLSMRVLNHGEPFADNNDRVYIRGNDQDDWIFAASWIDSVDNTSGVYKNISNIPISALLQLNSQNFSSSFQLKVVHSGRFPAVSLFSNGGVSFDNISIVQNNPTDVQPLALVHPIPFGCTEDQLSVCASIQNSGVDTVSNFPVYLNWRSGPVSGSDTLEYASSLSPGQTDTICFAPFQAPAGGSFTFEVVTNNLFDDIQLNDTLATTFFLQPLDAPNLLNDSLCIGGFSQLQINVQDTFSTFDWYDAPMGGNLVASGLNVTTPPLFNDTSFYIETQRQHQFQVGPPNNNSGNGTYSPNYFNGMRFDAHTSIVIDSLQLYISGSGELSLTLKDSVGSVYRTIVYSSIGPATGGICINPDLYVPKGNNWTLTLEGSSNIMLYYTFSGVSYPYQVPGVLSLTGTESNLQNNFFYFYKWHVSVASCSGLRKEIIVKVNPPTEAGFSLVENGTEVTFTDTSLHDPGTFSWDFDNTFSSTDQHPVHDFITDGTYNVCLIADNGCEADTACSIIGVCAPLQAGYSWTSNGTIIDFTDTTLGSPISWQWDFGDSDNGSGTFLSHSYASDGIYPVQLIVSNNCGDTDTFTASIPACAPLVANFSFTNNGNSYFFTDESSGNITNWLWDFGDGTFSTLPDPSHSFSNGGPDTVFLTVYNVCNDSSTFFVLDGSIGIASNFYEEAVVAFPNPFSDVLSINHFGAWRGKTVHVYSADGRCCSSFLVDGAKTTELNTSDWPHGCYFLKAEGIPTPLRVVK